MLVIKLLLSNFFSILRAKIDIFEYKKEYPRAVLLLTNGTKWTLHGPFVHCQSYRVISPKGTHRVPGIHFENHCLRLRGLISGTISSISSAIVFIEFTKKEVLYRDLYRIVK